LYCLPYLNLLPYLHLLPVWRCVIVLISSDEDEGTFPYKRFDIKYKFCLGSRAVTHKSCGFYARSSERWAFSYPPPHC
jgi:hypothetical protein